MRKHYWFVLGSLCSAVVTTQLAAVSSAKADEAPCYIAFVHGSGSDYSQATIHEGFNTRISDDGAASNDAIAGYWTPDRAPADTNYNNFTFWGSRANDGPNGCVSFRVGYNGNDYWWAGAKQVADQINSFITKYDIQDGRLIIMTHSMGGIVGRWILNNGVPNSAYFNYAGADYARIYRKTSHMITVQAPHGGTQIADAIYGQADHYFSIAAGEAALFFGGQDRTNARDSLRRAYMRDAVAWLGDAGRNRLIFTVAGDSVDNDAGEGMDNDNKLQTAWAGVCYRKAWFNAEGGACNSLCAISGDPITCAIASAAFSATAGDGLVELGSANGDWNGGLKGARRKWLEIHDNHNHGRFDRHYGRIKDFVRGVTENNYPGSYIGTFGLNIQLFR